MGVSREFFYEIIDREIISNFEISIFDEFEKKHKKQQNEARQCDTR